MLCKLYGSIIFYLSSCGDHAVWWFQSELHLVFEPSSILNLLNYDFVIFVQEMRKSKILLGKAGIIQKEDEDEQEVCFFGWFCTQDVSQITLISVLGLILILKLRHFLFIFKYSASAPSNRHQSYFKHLE